jgi:hypothetical protein
VLSRTQAVGTGIQLELSVGSYENEPISNYKGTVFADIGKSVGRLDVLTDKGMFPCTAFIVSKQHILTNYHCSLGLLDDERIGATRIDGVDFLAGYTQTGIEEGTRRYRVTPTPVEFSAELDYAVLEVLGNPSQEYGELKLAHQPATNNHINRYERLGTCRSMIPGIGITPTTNAQISKVGKNKPYLLEYIWATYPIVSRLQTKRSICTS